MEDRKGDEKIEPYSCEISGISKEVSGYNIMRKKTVDYTWIFVCTFSIILWLEKE